MTWALAVLSERLQSLVDEIGVVLVDVETQQSQASSGAATYTVQELQRLTDHVVFAFSALHAQEVLE